MGCSKSGTIVFKSLGDLRRYFKIGDYLEMRFRKKKIT